MATTGGSAAAATTIDYDATAKVAIYDTFSGWCFANNLANSALMAGRTIYETLFEKTTNNDLVGLLAVKGAPIDGTGLKQWKVTLREGIKFHDGTPFDAEAVVANWSFGSAGDGTDPNTYFGAIFPEVLRIMGLAGAKTEIKAGGIGTKKITVKQAKAFNAKYKKEIDSKDPVRIAGVGLAAAGAAAAVAESVSSKAYMVSTAVAFSSNILKAEATGEYEVTYTLDRAQNDFLGTTYASGRSFQRAVSQFEDSSKECVSTPIGTGPFKVAKITDWSTNKLKVVRNNSYWRKDAAGAKLPYLKSITFENVKEVAQRANAVVTGTFDAAMFGSGDGKFNQTLRKNKAVAEIKSAVEYYPSLWLNQGKPGSPFASANARLAVTSCIDRAGYLRVRATNEGKVAKSLVGPTNIMYNETGFDGALNVAKSKDYVAAYKTETGKTKLQFTIPSDVSTTSIANIKFLQDQWKKCGITAVMKTSEAANIIAKTFNASPDTDKGEYYNAYDAIIILLMEGTDVTFNMPFVLTNAYSTGSIPEGATAARPFGNALKAKLFGPSIGSVLSLNHHKDTKVDDLFFAAQAQTDAAAAKTKFAEATAYLQSTGIMSSIVHGYYNMFYNKKNGLKGFGVLTLPSETDVAAGLRSTGTSKQREISNWGVDWTGVYKAKK
jgi:ABC-type transport system substrate-binding protein